MIDTVPAQARGEPSLADLTAQILAYLREKFPRGQKYNSDLARDWAKRARAASKAPGDAAAAITLMEEVCAHSDQALASRRISARSMEAQADYNKTQELIALYHQTMNTTLEPPPTAAGATPPSPDQDAPRQPDRILIDRIVPNPFQPRRTFNQDSIIELANSIRFTSLQNVPLVRLAPDSTLEDESWQLISGERRLRALKYLRDAGEWDDTIPVKVCDVDDVTALEMAIAENRDREGVNAIDEAQAFANLEKKGRTQAQIGERFKLTQGAVSNKIRLLGLPEEVRAFIAQGKEAGGLSPSHGVALLSLDTPAEQSDFARTAVAETLSKAALERQIAEHKAALEAENAPKLPFTNPNPSSGQITSGLEKAEKAEKPEDLVFHPTDPLAVTTPAHAAEIKRRLAEADAEDEDAEDDSHAPEADDQAPEPDVDQDDADAEEAAPARDEAAREPALPAPVTAPTTPDAATGAAEEDDQADAPAVDTKTKEAASEESDSDEEADDDGDADTASQSAPAEPSEAAGAAEDGATPDGAEPAPGDVSSAVPALLNFTGAPKMIQALIPSDLQAWQASNAVTTKQGLIGYARLHAFAEGYEWTPESLLDALEGRDLALLETLQARLVELAMAIHDA